MLNGNETATTPPNIQCKGSNARKDDTGQQSATWKKGKEGTGFLSRKQAKKRKQHTQWKMFLS